MQPVVIDPIVDRPDTNHFDVICIGAGITSLAYSALLTQKHPGIKLLIMDKHNIPGGYATTFARTAPLTEFDCSLHKVSGMNQDANLYKILCQLGIDQKLKFRSDHAFFTAYFWGSDETQIVLKNNATSFKQQLIARYPKERAGIDHFFSDVMRYGKQAYLQFHIMQGEVEPDMADLRYAHKHLKGRTVHEVLEEIIKTDELKLILSAPAIYVGGFPEDLSYLYYLHIVYATLVMGNAFFEHSNSQSLSNHLVDIIRSNGGCIMLSTRVKKILVDSQTKAQGVVTKRGNFYAKHLVINTSPHYALDHLFDPQQQPILTGVREKLRYLKPSRSTTTLHLILDRPPKDLEFKSAELMCFGKSYQDAFSKRMELIPKEQTEKINHDQWVSWCETAFWEYSTMELTDYHGINPEGGHVVIMNVLDCVEHWPMRNSAAYKQKKQRATDVLLSRMSKSHPKLKESILYSELSSPRTYQRYTNNSDGAGYGALVGTQLNAHAFHHRFPIAGIYFMSAWVAGPSYEAAFGYAQLKLNTGMIPL